MQSLRSSDVRILDRSTYEKKTLIVYEVMAAYYVDLYYNHAYFEGRRVKITGKVSSITEGYKHVLTAMQREAEQPKHFTKTLNQIKEVFIKAGFDGMLFGDCLDTIVKEFVPVDYYQVLTKQQKLGIIKEVIKNVNQNFIPKLVRQYLTMIIDRRKELDNPRILQDDFIDLLLIERETFYNRFISAPRTTNYTSEITERLKEEVKTLCEEKHKLHGMIIQLKKIIISKENEKKSNLEEIRTLKEKVQDLSNELIELKSEKPSSPVKVIEEHLPSSPVPQQEETTDSMEFKEDSIWE